MIKKVNRNESISSKHRPRRMNESNGTINDLEFYIAQIQDTARAIARLSDHATDIVNNYQEIEDDAGELRGTENDLLGFVKELQMWKEGFANYIGQMEEWVDNVLL
jgi:lysyl-tRNA synthetase class II